MPRSESRISQTRRLTRSGRVDPLWSTIIFLQERVNFLERQVRRGGRSLREVENERQRLFEEVERLSSHGRLRELELENENLRREVLVLRIRLVHLNARAPIPFNRTFSSFDFD
jgi:hypothetical protein